MAEQRNSYGVIRLAPALDAKPWGGHKLKQMGMRVPPGTIIGEAHLTGAAAGIVGGPFDGVTLGELVARDPEGIAGSLGLAATGGLPVFPLLIKLIDANDVLSVQVHPGDEEANALNSVGKTEAWHVLSADVGSGLYLGLHDPQQFDELALLARSGGRTSALLREIPARPHETVLIPAGTIHALGAGILVYEIQQPSGITFRFDDWGRVGADGKSRELHIEESIAVSHPELQPEPIEPIETSPGRSLLTACRYFALEKLELQTEQELTIKHIGSPAAITLIDGDGEVEAGGVIARIQPGETVVIAPGDLPAILRSRLTTLTALHGWVPDLQRDIVDPARAAGADDEMIAKLAGPRDDLRRLTAVLPDSTASVIG
ncbi:MAG: type I phosphomannose isomerase catalytic subunit [Thermomicrobiales bacterium]